MKLTLSLAKKLQQLIDLGEMSYSQFNKNSIDTMLEEGVLEICHLSRSKKHIKIKSKEYLNNYLFTNYHINNLNDYIEVLSNEEASRADLSIASSNSKIKKETIFTGFLINTYQDIFGTLNNKELLLKPTKGSFIFINDYKNFKISEDINIIVIENFENFKHIELQKNLFDTRKNLFIWRYQNNALSDWLSLLPNKYIHFGDFDLSGIMIYLNLKKKRNNINSSFFIPKDIENLLVKYGNRERYFNQEIITKNINFSEHEEIFELSNLIKKHQKSLEQEILIKLSI